MGMQHLVSSMSWQPKEGKKMRQATDYGYSAVGSIYTYETEAFVYLMHIQIHIFADIHLFYGILQNMPGMVLNKFRLFCNEIDESVKTRSCTSVYG